MTLNKKLGCTNFTVQNTLNFKIKIISKLN